ncbi:MAG: M20/M25/M40 family metallo-hydrolase, partial [Mariprofundus sp.]|nr:M20/M25/M40 family metallo-hydrolase [Mariprofundus sp.]
MSQHHEHSFGNQSMAAQLKQAVDAIMPDVVHMRRELHQQPELSGQEQQTAKRVAACCRELGLDVREGIGGHGLLACLKSDEAKPWLAFRADMDALPIADGKQRPYASRIDEVSHSCGHDAHTAMLLGVMRVLHEFKDRLHHNIAYIFQPAEETCQGASAMLRDDLFRDFKPEQIYALHVYPYL